VPGDPDVQQPQGGDAPVYLQLHDIPPQLRTSETATAAAYATGAAVGGFGAQLVSATERGRAHSH
jgi:hypothetical protein